MSRTRVDPVDAAFQRIVALDPAQYARLQERLIGWAHKTGAPPAPRKRLKKSQEAAAL